MRRNMRLIETDIPGHLTFEKPPEGFSALRATDAQLREYGLPHRPDPDRFPREARLWQNTMARIKKFVTPKLTLRPDRVHGSPNLPIVNPGVNSGKSSIWSGLITSAGVGYSQIWGSWFVPMIAVPNFGFSSLWIGLNDSQSLFQAGTQQDSVFSENSIPGNAFPTAVPFLTYAWYEWFPGPTVGVGLEVFPGHSVGVNLQPAIPGRPVGTLEPTSDEFGSGIVEMINYTTGVAITPVLVPPPTKNYNNKSIKPPIFPTQQADWIMERTSLLENGSPVAQALPDFGIAGFLFGGAIEYTAGSVLKGPTELVTLGEGDRGTLLTMFANDGTTKLAEAVERPGLNITFLNSGP
jgi:hypothetical protein